MSERCDYAIAFGVTLHTRCMKDADHPESHVGRGLRHFTYQRVEWLRGDRREYRTTRNDEYAWESSRG